MDAMNLDKRLGFVPVLLSVAVLMLGAFLYYLGIYPVAELPYFVPIAGTVIMLPIALYFAYVSSIVYEKNHDVNILLIGAGILSYGLTAFASGWFQVTQTIPVNAPVTIYSIGALISSIFLFLGASLTMDVESLTNKIKQLDVIVYVLLLASLAVISCAAFSNELPSVFVNGVGNTFFGTEILTATFTLFVAILFLFALLYLRTKSEIIYWNLLAIAMLVLTILAAQSTKAIGDLLSWDSRVSQLIGMTYFLISVRVAFNASRKQE